MAKAPGIRPRTLMDVPLKDLGHAKSDPTLLPIKLNPSPQKRRKGLRLMVRKLAYFALRWT